MKKQIIFIILFLFSLSPLSKAQYLWLFKKDTVVSYYYEDGDEFNTASIDQNKWKDWYGWARSIYNNKEQQYYTYWKNHELKDGNLLLTPKKEVVNERMVDWMNDYDSIFKGNKTFDGFNKRMFNYTSGMIQSKNQYLYGYFEMRFKAPSDYGVWPAFWLYGGDPNEEIDFFELKGEKKDQVRIDTHCPKKCDYFNKGFGIKRTWGGWVKITGKLNEGYNIVSGEWTPDYIRYYINGECIGQVNVKFNIKKALVANVAIPSDNGPFKPGPDFQKQNTFEPLVIDYIRVWNLEDKKTTSPLLSNDNNRFGENVTKKNIDARYKKAKKFIYGKKDKHKKDGIVVSMLQKTSGTYELICSGLKKNEKVFFEVSDIKGKSKSFESSTTNSTIDVSELSTKDDLNVKISYKGLSKSSTIVRK